MSTDYDEVLRRALHAAADTVEPNADGLERIRARLGPPQLLSLASAVAWCSAAVARLAMWARPAVESALAACWSVIDRFRPAEPRPGQAGPRFGWLRPLAAMGTAIFVVAAGAFAVMTLPQAISSSGSIKMFWEQKAGPGHHAGKSTLNGSSSQPFVGANPTGPYASQPATSPASSQCSAVKSSPPSSATPTPPSMSASTTPTTPASSPPATSPPPATTTPATPTPTPSSSSSPGSVGTPSPPASTAGPTTAPTAPTAADTGGARGTALDRTTLASALSVPQAVLMLPSKSSSPAKSPCPSSSAKKNKPTKSGGQASGGQALPGSVDVDQLTGKQLT